MPKSAVGKKDKAKTEARLGIFWLLDGNLLIESASLSECEPYGDHLTFPRGHNDVWEDWQKSGKAPIESEYEEYARGRVMCDSKGKQFTLLADKCILARKEFINRIKKELYLPRQTSLATDPHYRCFRCLHGAEDDEE